MKQGNEAFSIYDSNIRNYVCKYQPTYKNLVDMGENLASAMLHGRKREENEHA